MRIPLKGAFRLPIRSKGFYLIDVLISATLLSLIILPVAGLFLHGQNMVRNSINQTSALVLAQDRIEEIKALPFHEIKDDGDRITVESIFLDDVDYERTTILEWEDNLVTITVEVLWKERSVELVTCRGDF